MIARMMLELLDLHHGFGDLVALDGVTVTVEAGEIVGLVGRSGAGKTTTMRAVMGILWPDRSSVRRRGHAVGFETSGLVDLLPPARHLVRQ